VIQIKIGAKVHVAFSNSLVTLCGVSVPAKPALVEAKATCKQCKLELEELSRPYELPNLNL